VEGDFWEGFWDLEVILFFILGEFGDIWIFGGFWEWV